MADSADSNRINRRLFRFALLILFVGIGGCGTGEYDRLLDAAIQSAPRGTAPAENVDAGPDEAASGRQRGGQTQLGGRQSTIGMALSAAARLKATNNVGQIMTTLVSYELDYGKFPSQAITKDGQALLSWRVELLKKLDPNLYSRFKLDEPWDSENNIALLDFMPEIFDVGYSLDLGYTAVLAVVSDDTLFSMDASKARRNVDIRDRPNQTIAVVVTDSGSAVPWTKPEDMVINPSDPAKGIAWPDGNFIGGFVDGSAKRITTTDAETLMSAFTISGGELIASGQL